MLAKEAREIIATKEHYQFRYWVKETDNAIRKAVDEGQICVAKRIKNISPRILNKVVNDLRSRGFNADYEEKFFGGYTLFIDWSSSKRK